MIYSSAYSDHTDEQRPFTVSTVRSYRLLENGNFHFRKVQLFDYPGNDHDAFASVSATHLVTDGYARDEYKATAAWDNPNDYGWDNY